jgi:hypothetical protein
MFEFRIDASGYCIKCLFKHYRALVLVLYFVA